MSGFIIPRRYSVLSHFILSFNVFSARGKPFRWRAADKIFRRFSAEGTDIEDAFSASAICIRYMVAVLYFCWPRSLHGGC